MTEQQIADISSLGWTITKCRDGRTFVSTPNKEFSIDEDFGIFWVNEQVAENKYESIDAFSKLEDAINLVKAWMK